MAGQAVDPITEEVAAVIVDKSGFQAALQAPLFYVYRLSILSDLTAIVRASDRLHCGFAVVRCQEASGCMGFHMIKQSACLLALMAGGIAQVHAEQGCPYPSSVKYEKGYFIASNGQSSWQSPKVDVPDFADRFIGALFTPGKGQERENGYLDKCVYLMGNGQVVALRYDMPERINTMSLTSTLYWELANDALKQVVYICEDRQPDNCAFTVRSRN